MLWESPLGGPGLGGIAATDRLVIFGDRDLQDQRDVFRCYDAELGLPLWIVEYDAPGQLDYGNTPRTTPLIHDGRVYLLGAFGDLHCVNLDTGEIIWRLNLRERFQSDAELPWGYCGSPFIVDNKLIVNPGAESASLVALKPESGELVWAAPGRAPGYGSFIVATLGGVEQIVGYDATSLGGWNVETGKRRWELVPAEDGDFNVPTPVVFKGCLLVATENNGTRLYAFDDQGRIKSEPVASNLRLSPDMTTPVVIGDQLFCVDRLIYRLDLSDPLRLVWQKRDRALSDYASLIASDDRLLVVGSGELLLLDAKADRYEIISRLRVFEDNAELYSHPAIIGDRLYIRGETLLRCIKL